jgi:cobalt-precorrin 5A hydrolase
VKLYVAAFSEKGRQLAKRIERIPLSIDYGTLSNAYGGKCVQSKTCVCLRKQESLAAWTTQAFLEGAPLLFLGAAGIAVRAIAGQLVGKAVDSPVLVIDEVGQFVIPILSGHLGGANELATQLANGLGAQAVLTTATDVNHVWAVDVFARKHGLQVWNTDGIAPVSAKLLAGERVTMAIEGKEEIDRMPQFPDEITLLPWSEFCRNVCQTEQTCDETIASDQLQQTCGDTIASVKQEPERLDTICDIVITSKEEMLGRATLGLKPKRYILGIGCKKGKTYIEIQQTVGKIEEEGRFKIQELAGVASIDVKQEEPGICEFAERNRLPFYVFTKDELLTVPGKYQGSTFVEQTIGVDNVCERAAVAASGGGTLVVPKQAQDGITIAVARTNACLTLI